MNTLLGKCPYCHLAVHTTQVFGASGTRGLYLVFHLACGRREA